MSNKNCFHVEARPVGLLCLAYAVSSSNGVIPGLFVFLTHVLFKAMVICKTGHQEFGSL